MNDIVDIVESPSGKSAEELAGLKNITMVVYALEALSFLWGITAIIAIVINYVKREDVAGSVYQSHFDWQIKTFWWGLVWMVLGICTIWLAVGFFVLFAGWVWTIYRVVKGWIRLNEGKPVMPA